MMMRRKIMVGSIALAIVLVGCAAVAIALSGPGESSNAQEVATSRYLDKRYALERDIDQHMAASVRAAEEVSYGASRRCRGVMADAPHNVGFGTLNAAVLWTPRVAMWHVQKPAIMGFVRATADITWKNQALTELAGALSREEQSRVTLGSLAACHDLELWKAKRYGRLPHGVASYLEKIGEISSIGEEAIAKLGLMSTGLEHCTRMKSGRTICTSPGEVGTAPYESKVGSPQRVLLELLARSAGAVDRRLAKHIIALEDRIAGIEAATAVRGETRMTKAIGLDPQVLKLVESATG